MTALAALPRDALATPGPARVALIRAAAEGGDTAAQMILGQMLLDGVETPRDARAALGWFKRAAATHDAMAINMVGRCYELGHGAPVDMARAAQCYRIAAAHGLPEAMYNHATRLALGEGVSQDRVAALALLEAAAARGYAKAVNFVGSFAEDGWAGPIDMARAADCYARAAAGGDFRGAFNHARMLAADGRIAEARDWIDRAVAGGTPAFAAKVARWCAASDSVALRAHEVAC